MQITLRCSKCKADVDFYTGRHDEKLVSEEIQYWIEYLNRLCKVCWEKEDKENKKEIV